MKTLFTNTMVTLGLALGLGCISRAFGDLPATAPPEKTLEGVATSISQPDKTNLVKTFWSSKTVNLADDCKVLLPDKSGAGLAALRPGQRVKINYENIHGVRVAHQIEQENMAFTGHVMAMDPTNHLLTLRHRGLDKTFQIAGDCKVVLRNQKTGTFAEVQPGHRVTVTYELPGGVTTARVIAQTSEVFNGALTAIDLTDRTVKAESLMNGKKFNLADDCAIVISGKPDAKLSDLKLGDKLVFSYHDVNGVNIVSRIGTVPAPSEPMSTAARRPNYNYGMPLTPPY